MLTLIILPGEFHADTSLEVLFPTVSHSQLEKKGKWGKKELHFHSPSISKQYRGFN